VTTVAHLSDLHFGAHLPLVAEALRRDLHALAPTLVIVSGDFTQRARRSQFAEARKFLDQLPFPRLVIPGNHDIPLYDVVRRFLSPLGRYHRYISADENPLYEDPDLFVIGLNTARSLTWKNGRISLDQLKYLDDRLPHAGSRLKVIVTHHPFIPPPDGAGIDLVGRAALALPILVAHKVDLLLAGHLHHGYVGDTRAHYPGTDRGVIAVQAGTAISHRVRGEPNAYNLLSLSHDRMEIETRIYRDSGFRAHASVRFERRDHVWLRSDAAPP
jgi:3',5'-cyclic AMP phosphodiesterase CpdA